MSRGRPRLPGRSGTAGAGSPEAARALAVRLLLAHGLALVASNARGDSAYLARPGATRTVRVSSHARTPRQRRAHPEIVASVVIRDVPARAEIERRVAAALRAYARALDGPARAAPAPAGP